MSEAMFRSVRSALAFAYSIAAFTTTSKQSDTGPLAELTAVERQAQGALIRRVAEEHLTPLEMASMFAYHGAGRFKDAGERELCWRAAHKIRNRSLGVALAKRQFSCSASRRGHQELSDRFGVSLGALGQLDSAVCDELDRIRLLAEKAIQREFVLSGIAATL